MFKRVTFSILLLLSIGLINATAINTVFTESATIDANSAVYNFSGMNISTEDSTRIIVIGASGRGSGVIGINTLTIGGISATKIIGLTAFINVADLWWAEVPTGTTEDIIVTFDRSITGAGIGIWALYNSNGTIRDTDSSSDSSGTDAVSIDLTVPANGSAIATNKAGGLISASTWTWTGVTEDFEQTLEIG